MSHTPGDWQNVDGNSIWSGMDMVADLMADDPETREADARLIAAAPQMLEALQGVAGEGMLALSPHVEETWGKVLEAIKAATGEE